jgi:glycosyltransferase involved in cell wall biosynthesis
VAAIQPIILSPLHLRALAPFLPEKGKRGEPLPPGEGGYPVTQIILERIKRGLPTEAVTLDSGLNRAHDTWEGEMLTVNVVRRRKRGALRDGYRNERDEINRVLDRSQAQVCHAHWTYEYGLAATDQSRLPVVLTVHDHALNCAYRIGPCYYPHFILALQVLLRKRSVLTAVSPYVAQFVNRVTGADARVVANMLDLDPMLGDFSSSNKIVSALSWSKLKNAKRAMRAFKIVHGMCPDVRLFVFGDGLEMEGMASLWARDRGLDKGVQFNGRVSHREWLQQLNSASVLLHPSLEESFGMTVAEAMLFEIPVVACRQAAGCSWLLEEGRHGFLVNGRNEKQLADAILKALSKDTYRAERLRKARNRIADLCSPDKVLEAYEDVYASAMRQQNK